LHFLLQDLEGLVDVIVSDENLHAILLSTIQMLKAAMKFRESSSATADNHFQRCLIQLLHGAIHGAGADQGALRQLRPRGQTFVEDDCPPIQLQNRAATLMILSGT
jgi:hypothetical protein